MDTTPPAISRARFEAVVCDLDGVVDGNLDRAYTAAGRRCSTRISSAARRPRGDAFRPFDEKTDYRVYVDDNHGYDGVRDVLAARGIKLSWGQSH